MTNEPRITLLHLSDLQFGPHHRFEGAGSPGSLLHRLRDDLEKLQREEGVRPDLVMLTGDLTEYGLKSHFDQLLSFAQGLTEVTGLPPRRIVIVPGNHDVNWGFSEAYFSERKGSEANVVLPYWPKFRAYAEFFARFYEGQPGISFSEAEPYTLFDYPELRVVVAGLNSAIAESHRKEDHYGYLGEQQLRFFAEKLRPYKESGILRIGAIHHDPLNLGENEAARQDQKDFKGMLGPYLNFVTHGHIHEEKLGWLDNDLPVLAIGSAGVKVAERPPEVPNQYQIIQLSTDRLIYGTRAYVPDQKRWIDCLRSDANGKTGRVEEKIAFARVESTFSGGTATEAAPVADLALMVDKYRQHWAKAFRHEALFELATRGEDSDIPAGLDLIHVFLAQTARRESRSLDLPRDLGADADDEDALRNRLHPRHDEDRRRDVVSFGPPQPIDQVVVSPGEPWLLVLGAPGAGKSALTRWLVLKLCAPGESLAGLPADLVPVRIELRRFDLQYSQAHKAGRSYDFFDYLDESHREYHLSLQGEPLRRLAESGRLLWLFDGLDEVANPRARSEYARMIAGLRERHGGRGVVTSRIVGARPVQPLLESAGLATYTLQDFDEKQIDAFLEQWHRLAFPGALEAGVRRLERLRSTLQENRAVRDLCGNPLLLTLIALLNRGGELPKQRHRLYDRTVDLMAENWEANKQLNGNGAIGFDLADKKRFLRQLAFRMMSDLPGGAGNAIGERDLISFASEFCAREYSLDGEKAGTRAEQLIAHLRERNYVLTLLGGQTFGFVHKTFLEYLTAAEVQARFQRQDWTLDEVKKVFKEHWQDQAWEETLTLICGMQEEERPEQVVELLQDVLKEVDPFSDPYVQRFVNFAIRCVIEIRQLDQNLVRTFAQRLTDAILDVFPWWFSEEKLLSAFRLCGSAWPGADRIYAATPELQAEQPTETTSRARRSIESACSLALCPRTDRVARIAQLAAGNLNSQFLGEFIEEAARSGEWTEQEIASLTQIIERSPSAFRLTAWIALLASGVDAAANRIADIQRGSKLDDERCRAAATLIYHPKWRTEAADVLLLLYLKRSADQAGRVMFASFRDLHVGALIKVAASNPSLRSKVRCLLSSHSPLIQYATAREMALLWRDDEAIQIWLRGITDRLQLGDDELSALYDLAKDIPDARVALEALLDDMSDLGRMLMRIFVAEWLVHRDPLRSVRSLSELAFSPQLHPQIRARAADALLEIREGKANGIEALVRAAEVEATPSDPQSSVQMLAKHKDDPDAIAALVRLMRTGGADDLRTETAIKLVLSNSTFRSEAACFLSDVIAVGANEVLCARAASALRVAGFPQPDWRPAIEHLARAAKLGSTRLQAAKELRDESRIARLAEGAKSPKVREDAAEALQRLRFYCSLLNVGRRRRGVVSLDGTRAGVIEETAQGSRFTYDTAYLTRPRALAISPTLPLRPVPYESSGLHPFFENLLPEGWLLDRTCTKLGLDRTDAFGLMLATCADCAGAVEIVPEAA